MIPSKTLPGQRPDRSSRTQDGMIDAIAVMRTEQNASRAGNHQVPTTNKGNVVYALNNTGVDIPRYGIVRLLNTYDSTPSTDSGDYAPRAFHGALDVNKFKQYVFLEAKKSADEFGEVVGIAQLPCKNNTVGRFLVEGVTQCKIKLDEAPEGEEQDNMEYATPTEENVDYMYPVQRGPAVILWKEPNAVGRTVWAVVRIRHVPRPHGITLCQAEATDNQFRADDVEILPGTSDHFSIIMTFERTEAYCGFNIAPEVIPGGDEGENCTTLKNVSGRPITGWVGWNISVQRIDDGDDVDPEDLDPETEVKVELLRATPEEADDEVIWGSVGWISSSRRAGQQPSNSAAGFMLVTLDTDQFIKVRLTGYDMDPGGTDQNDLMCPIWKGCHLSFYDPGNAFIPDQDEGEGNPLSEE